MAPVTAPQARPRRTLVACAVTLFATAIVSASALLPANTVHAQGAYPEKGGKKGALEPASDASAQLSAALEAPAASAIDGHKPWVPNRDVPPVPTEDSPVPTKKEWDASPIAKEVRVTEPGCRAQRIREHYRVVCNRHAAIELIAGTRKALTFGEFREAADAWRPEEVWVVFPAKPGDRRFLQVYRRTKWGKAVDAEISEVFLEGEPLPRITVQGHRFGI